MTQDMGASAEPTGLGSPEGPEPDKPSPPDGAIPSADVWGEEGILDRFTRAAEGINRLAKECRDITARATLSRQDAALIDAKAYLRGVTDAYVEARGTNADLCRQPGNAYRVMIDALNKLRHKASHQLHAAGTPTRSAETEALSPKDGGAVAESDAPQRQSEV